MLPLPHPHTPVTGPRRVGRVHALWTTLWGAFLAVSVVVVLAVASVAWSTLTFVLTYAVLAVTSALLMAAIHDLRAAAPIHWTRLLRRAAFAGAGLTALVALVQFSVALAVGCLIVTTLSGPPALWALRASLRHSRTRGATPPDYLDSKTSHLEAATGRQWRGQPPASGPNTWDWADAVDDAVLGALSPTELCWAWQTSYARLMQAPDVGARAAIAGCRQRYLDELERRDAAGLGNWFHAGARAASSPKRYLT